MNIKTALTLFSLIFLSVFFVNTTFAAEFQLTNIGALDTGGARYSDWWYTGSNPTLSGTGDPNVEITVSVGDDEYKTQSDSSGNWSVYLPLSSGDYDVDIQHDQNNTYVFTLHLGQNVPADLGGSTQSTQSTGSVPTTGSNQLIGITFAAGVMLLAFYLYVWGNPRKKFVYSKKIID